MDHPVGSSSVLIRPSCVSMCLWYRRTGYSTTKVQKLSLERVKNRIVGCTSSVNRCNKGVPVGGWGRSSWPLATAEWHCLKDAQAFQRPSPVWSGWRRTRWLPAERSGWWGGFSSPMPPAEEEKEKWKILKTEQVKEWLKNIHNKQKFCRFSSVEFSHLRFHPLVRTSYVTWCHLHWECEGRHMLPLRHIKPATASFRNCLLMQCCWTTWKTALTANYIRCCIG